MKCEPKYGTEQVINGRIVYSDIRDEIAAHKEAKARMGLDEESSR